MSDHAIGQALIASVLELFKEVGVRDEQSIVVLTTGYFDVAALQKGIEQVAFQSEAMLIKDVQELIPSHLACLLSITLLEGLFDLLKAIAESRL